MDAIFLKLLDMSLSAGWVVLGVLLLRLVLRKAPRWIHSSLWALVAIRLVCPFSFESVVSLVPEFPSPQTAVETSLPETTQDFSRNEAAGAGDRTIVSNPNPQSVQEPFEAPLSGNGTAGQAGSTREKTDWLRVACGIWAVGTAVLLVYAAVSYLRLRKRVAVSIGLGNDVFLCDYIRSPFILGIVKPRIYLPSEMDPRDTALVLAHERAHLKRRDHWWKPFGFCLLTVYWFHPLLWVAYLLLCRDIELACDELVVKDMALGEKKAYSEALLTCSVSRHMIAACPLAFGEVGVKERVKHVLHYKKPAFWAILIAVVICLIAAACFLTDPAAHTLAKLLDIEEKKLTKISVESFDGFLYLDSPEEYELLLELLEEAEYDAAPVAREPIRGEVDEYGWAYPRITLFYGEDQVHLYFSFDYTQVWKADPEGTSLPYAVLDPAPLQAYIRNHARAVYQQSTSAEPFAAQSEPLKWAGNMHSAAALEARLYVAEPDLTLSATRISYALLEVLLQHLNGLTEESFGAEQTDDQFNYDDLRYFSGSPIDTVGASIVVSDGANDLTGIIRLYDGKLELLLLEGAQWLGNYWRMEATTAKIWSIEDDALRGFMEGLILDHPTVLFSLGMKYDFERAALTVSHGNAHFSALVMTDWDYEIVEYTEGAESFGIRCRPKAVDEGWIYFSFWPEGYDPVEEDRYYSEAFFSGYRHVSSYPSAVKTRSIIDPSTHPYSYSKTEYTVGDHAVINEGADAWFQEYRDAISDQHSFITFRYGATTENLSIRSYGDVTVDFSQLPEDNAYSNYALVYFDWDKIMAETGATELTLITQKMVGNELYLVGQYDDRFCFLCFRNTEMGYQFRTLLSDGELISEITEEGTNIQYADYRQADFQEEDDQKRLLLVLDEDVTAIQNTAGNWDYQRLDSFPALLVLDKELWSSVQDYGYTFRYDEPPTICYDSNLGLGPLVFTGAAPESKEIFYLYGGLVTFYDGVHQPGGYELENEDLEKLKEILVSLPEGTITSCPEPEEETLYLDLQLYVDNGLGFSEKEVLFYFSYNKTDVTITLQTGGAGAWTKRFFRVQDSNLNAFMEALCDDSRRSFNISAWGQPETISYSHGEGSIVLENRLGWEFEIVEYTDNETPFGIRCRPIAFDEGWVFFSYWPGGFTRPKDTDIHRDIHFQAGSYTFETGYYPANNADSASTWNYQKVRNVPGDYVILNEGADSWLDQEGIHFATLIRTDSFAGGAIAEEAFVYSQCDNPSIGPGNCVFGTNERNKGYLEIDPYWMFSIRDNDTIPYPHLFRFWPDWEPEGFISFAYMEDGFTPEEGLVVESISLSEPLFPVPARTATAEGSERWQYLWIDVEGGSYLFRNDGTDHWTDAQWQQVMEMIDGIVIAQYHTPQ